MAKGLSATQRTLRYIRAQGGLCDIVERFNPYGGKFGVRHDLFNIIDIIMLDPTEGIVGIQSCGQSFAEHDRKILESEYAVEWLKAGGKLRLVSWRKVKKKRGGKQMIWAPRIKEYHLEDFSAGTD